MASQRFAILSLIWQWTCCFTKVLIESILQVLSRASVIESISYSRSGTLHFLAGLVWSGTPLVALFCSTSCVGRGRRSKGQRPPQVMLGPALATTCRVEARETRATSRIYVWTSSVRISLPLDHQLLYSKCSRAAH